MYDFKKQQQTRIPGNNKKAFIKYKPAALMEISANAAGFLILKCPNMCF